MYAIIIKGNPRYINNSTAKQYYKDIESFLKKNGVTKVVFDSGDDGTLPPTDADLYVAHSRGVGRYQYMPEDKKKVFLKFGTPGGIIDPVDLKWHNEVYIKGANQQPPKEHFILIDEQKEAIVSLIKRIKAKDSGGKKPAASLEAYYDGGRLSDW